MDKLRKDIRPGSDRDNASRPLLVTSDLRRSFYGVAALQGVDLSINEGTLTGLIGPNGAGKSTLFNILSGMYRPDAGTVTFDGRDITRRRPHDIVGRGLIRTFQLARGFPKLTVFQHFMLYGRHQPGENAWRAIAGTRAARLREKRLVERAWEIGRRLRLDAMMNNPVTALSGGQKKLVEIGRALMAEPRMILLDEPMAGVNPTLTAQIVEHLVSLQQSGITVCLIEHDMALIRELCDPVIVMAEGRTLTKGSFSEVAGDTRVQEAYLGRRH